MTWQKWIHGNHQSAPHQRHLRVQKLDISKQLMGAWIYLVQDLVNATIAARFNVHSKVSCIVVHLYFMCVYMEEWGNNVKCAGKGKLRLKHNTKLYKKRGLWDEIKVKGEAIGEYHAYILTSHTITTHFV